MYALIHEMHFTTISWKKLLNEEYLHLFNGYLKHCTTEY